MRPLVKSADPADHSGKTADLSRQHVVEVSDTGVIRVGGGKLTTYREMAEDTVDEVQSGLGRSRLRRRRHPTKRLRLFVAERRPEFPRGSFDAHLAHRYGSAAAEVKALIALDPSLREPLVDGQPYVRAEAVYAVRSEMATTLDDVLLRRTRAHLFDRHATLRAVPAIAAMMATELGWDSAEEQRQIDDYPRPCAAEEAAGDHLTHAAD